MQDWKVAVLVVIIVVFVVLAALLLFLLYRFGHWRRLAHRKKTTTLRYIDDVENTLQEMGDSNGSEVYWRLFLHDPRLRPSSHVMYFIDFQGELLSIDFKKKKLRHITTEQDLQRYLLETFHPTIEEGNRVTTMTPEMLALSYVDDRQALVVLDLSRLLERDREFGARMKHTAERPLLLTRLVPDGVDGAVYTTLTRFGNVVDAPPAQQAASPAGGNLLAAPPQQQQQLQQQEILVDVAHSQANSMTAASSHLAAVPSPAPPAATHASSPPLLTTHAQPSPPQAARGTSIYSADLPGMAPAPVIHPCDTHHITTSTPITVTAATYTVLHRNGTRSVLDAANTAMIESARLRWDRRQSLVIPLVSGVFAGYHCGFDPVTENGSLLPPQGGGTLAEPLVCLRADAVQYTVERVNSTQWLPVERAFYLPAGRWCVRARSALYNDGSSKSVAKVFTVNVM
jgi:hypothetical protein